MELEQCISKAKLYIQNNLQEDLSVEKIAKEIGFSKFYFSRIFHDRMGLSVMEYVKKCRLVASMKNILDGDKIVDVAFRYGWQTHAGFIKAYQKEFGFSPSFLRAMLISMNEIGGNNMGNIYLKKLDPHMKKEELYQLLYDELENNEKFDSVELDCIYNLANHAYEGIVRYSGEEYITHTLHVALLLVQMQEDVDVILAGLLVDVLKKTRITEEEIKKSISTNIANLVIRVNQVDAIEEELDEIATIKIAERLENMRTIEFMDSQKWKIKAKETCDLFLPIAKRINNTHVIAELNELSMKYL